MKVYFIGICGTAMGNVAVLLKRAGHTVAGSDKGIYPPMCEVLADAGVELHVGWAGEHIESFAPDLVVIGNAVSRGNSEVEFVLSSKEYRYVSMPELIGEKLLRDRRRLVITGTHGKTTTTTIASWLLEQAGKNPGWLIGGVPDCLDSGARLGEGTFVLEGDEYDSAFFDKRSKFIHYRPDILVINNVEFDHADIFRDLEDVKRTFNHLLRTVPAEGIVLANGDDPVVRELLPVSWTRVCFVGTGVGNDYTISDFSENASGSSFKLRDSNGESWSFQWSLKGLFNARNAAMALLAVAYDLNDICPGEFFRTASLKGFTGVQRRQDVLFDSKSYTVIEDFAHHPTAIGCCIESLKSCYPEKQIVAVFEPRSNTSATRVLQQEFAESLSLADRVFVAPVHRGEIYADNEKMDTAEVVSVAVDKGKEGEAFESNSILFERLVELKVQGQYLVVLFTNGSFGEPLVDFLKKINA